MIKVSLKTDFTRLERLLMISVGGKMLREAAAVALTRTAAHATFALRKDMPDIFDRPTPFTTKSLLYRKADAVGLQASVFIRDDAAKGTPPAKYLGPEILGGPRRDKSSERQLKGKGLMQMGQSVVPGSGAQLDKYGNIPGPQIVAILSRIGAMSEVGYSMNATDTMKRRLAKAHAAVRKSGTNFFVAHAKRGGEPLAVYQLVSRGVVKPILWFANKRPDYAERFPFQAEVAHYAGKVWVKEMARALLERIKRGPGGR